MRAREIWMGKVFQAFDDLLDEGRTWALCNDRVEAEKLDAFTSEYVPATVGFVLGYLKFALERLGDGFYDDEPCVVDFLKAGRALVRTGELLAAHDDNRRLAMAVL